MKIIELTTERLVLGNEIIKELSLMSLIFWVNLSFSILVDYFELLSKPLILLFISIICILLIHFLFPFNKNDHRIDYWTAIVIVCCPTIAGILFCAFWILFILNPYRSNIIVDFDKNTFIIQDFFVLLGFQLEYPLDEIINVTAKSTCVNFYDGYGLVSANIPALVITRVRRNKNHKIEKTITFNYSAQEANIAADLINNFLISFDVSQSKRILKKWGILKNRF